MDGISIGWLGRSNGVHIMNQIHRLVRNSNTDGHVVVQGYIFGIFLAASMLIRTMLRVSPERRADIEEIAAHWWLNFDENLAVIKDLPENKVRV